MTVQFSVWDYWGELLLLGFGSFALILLVGLPLVYRLARKTTNPAIALMPLSMEVMETPSFREAERTWSVW